MLLKAKKQWLLQIVFSVILYTITYTVTFRLTGITSDYNIHMNWAAQIHRDNIISFFQSNPYFMWHFLVRIFYKIFAMPMNYAAAVVSALINVVVYLAATEIIKKNEVDKPEIISFCLMLIGPLYVPWFNPNYYLGQSTPNTWHNPTNLMVKPFAVCCFFLILRVLRAVRNSEKIKGSQWAGLSVLIFLSVLAKPSFCQAIIPGLGIYLIFLCVRNRFRDIKQYIYLCLTFAPSVLLMLYQALTYWGEEGTRGSIGISWLKVSSYYSPNVYISLLLTFGFPLLYLVLNWKRALKRTDVQLSICYYAVAWLEGALLYETVGTYSGNFGWAGLLATFILWMVIIICFFEDFQKFRMDDMLQVVKHTVLMIVFSIHLLCGSWYAYNMIVGPIWL